MQFINFLFFKKMMTFFIFKNRHNLFVLTQQNNFIFVQRLLHYTDCDNKQLYVLNDMCSLPYFSNNTKSYLRLNVRTICDFKRNILSSFIMVHYLLHRRFSTRSFIVLHLGYKPCSPWHLFCNRMYEIFQNNKKPIVQKYLNTRIL